MAQNLQSRTISEETYCRKLNAIPEILPHSLLCLKSRHFVFFIFRYCEAFPAIKGAIQRVKRERDRVKQKNDDKKSSNSYSKSELESKTKSDVTSVSSAGRSSKCFTLQRRLSTATPVRYDM